MIQPRIPAALRTAVRERAGNRCEYCRMPETGTFFPHEPDHVIAIQYRGQTEIENLALACLQCNRLKGPNIASVDPETKRIVPLFHPRTAPWFEHFRAEGGRIIPLTPRCSRDRRPVEFQRPGARRSAPRVVADGPLSRAS